MQIGSPSAGTTLPKCVAKYLLVGFGLPSIEGGVFGLVLLTWSCHSHVALRLASSYKAVARTAEDELSRVEPCSSVELFTDGTGNGEHDRGGDVFVSRSCSFTSGTPAYSAFGDRLRSSTCASVGATLDCEPWAPCGGANCLAVLAEIDQCWTVRGCFPIGLDQRRCAQNRSRSISRGASFRQHALTGSKFRARLLMRSGVWAQSRFRNVVVDTPLAQGSSGMSQQADAQTISRNCSSWHVPMFPWRDDRQRRTLRRSPSISLPPMGMLCDSATFVALAQRHATHAKPCRRRANTSGLPHRGVREGSAYRGTLLAQGKGTVIRQHGR